MGTKFAIIVDRGTGTPDDKCGTCRFARYDEDDEDMVCDLFGWTTPRETRCPKCVEAEQGREADEQS